MAKQNIDSRTRTPEIPIYLIAAFFVIFLVLFYFVASGNLKPNPEIPSSNVSGDVNSFRESLSAAKELSIVMNVTGLNGTQASAIFNCGVGFAGSWSMLKNLSDSPLHLYAIDGDSCTYSSPSIATDPNNSTISKTMSECVSEFVKTVMFDLRYGPNYDIYTDKVAYLFIDEEASSGCSFQRSGSGQPMISAEGITGILNRTVENQSITIENQNSTTENSTNSS